jgi:ABC-type Zn uptake system ZnuABC Zn-binding protein ZnuA
MSGPRTARHRRIPHFTLLFSLFTLPVLLLAACGDDDGSAGASDDDKIQVITTLPLFADFVRNVGGDRVEVTSLLPLGADPHTFEPSPRDVEKITEADIAFANGLDLEPSLIEVIEANLPDDAELVLLAYDPPTFGGDPDSMVWADLQSDDPHLWMDTNHAMNYAEIMLEGLTGLDPASAQTFRSNDDDYENQIREARGYLENAVTSVPEANRKLVTTHEAFTWLADSIGFEAVAAVVESPGEEPSPNEVAELTEAIESQNIPAVFGEPQIDEEGKILEQAAEDAGVQVCTLYSDSLDDEVSTYIEMMRFDADELARCLGAIQVSDPQRTVMLRNEASGAMGWPTPRLTRPPRSAHPEVSKE